MKKMMTIPDALLSGALEAEMKRLILEAADEDERSAAKAGLAIAKDWKLALARSKAPIPTMSKAVELAASIADIESHDLPSLVSLYAQEIRSGELEKEIQARLLKAISTDDRAAERTFALALAKARMVFRICQAGTDLDAVSILSLPACSTEESHEAIAREIKEDKWDAICRQILGRDYPVESWSSDSKSKSS